MKQALRILFLCGVFVVLGIFASSISDTHLREAVDLTNAYRDKISLGVAFVGGILLVLSPCSLPLLLAFFIETTAESRLCDKGRGESLRAARLLFLAGFFVVLLTLGFSTSLVGQLLIVYRETIVTIAGLMLVWFGLVLILGRKFLRRSLPESLQSGLTLGHPASYLLLGMGSAVGIGLCSTPILFSIFALTTGSTEVIKAFFLLTAFSFGLFTPFILLFTNTKLRTVLFQEKYFRNVEILGGALLVGMGLLYVIENSAAYLERDIIGLSRLSYYVQAYILAIPFLPSVLTLILLGGVFVWGLWRERVTRKLKEKSN